MKAKCLAPLALFASLMVPATASADLISLWVAAKGAYLNGKGQVYDKLQSQTAAGIEAGIELMGIDLPMVEAYILGKDQYMFTANVGFDVGFGDEIRVTAGLYTGLVFFIMPEQDPSDPVMVPTSAFLPESLQNDQTAKMQAQKTAQEFTDSYNDVVADEEAKLNKYALGLNLVRARLQVDYRLLPTLFLGIEGAFGYHYMLTGEDAIAEVKQRALDEELDKYPMLTAEQKKQIGDAIGARELETTDMNGTNYNIGIYLKLDI